MTHDSHDVRGGEPGESAEAEPPDALGSVVEQERGSLPFALIHGEALVACASWALGDAGVLAVDLGTEWAGLVDSGEPFVLHDALCPMTPASFIAACVREAAETDTVVVGVRPVTDTVKRLEDGVVGDTVDRAGLLAVASPVVLPGSVVAALDELPSRDFAELVDALRRRFPVTFREAPAEAARVRTRDDVRLLEALTRPE
jgi:2-C-methyl-D-erythritol 4-phosphate cytidylyltransferase